jgi:hypothetical protein
VKEKEKLKDKEKEKKVQKKKVEEVKTKKPKYKEEDSDEEDVRRNNFRRDDDYEDVKKPEKKIVKKQPTKVSAQKKPNLKQSTNTKVAPKNNNVKLSSTTTKPKTTGTTGNKLAKSTMVTNTIKVPTSKPASKPVNKPTIKSNITSASNRLNTAGNKTTSSRPVRQASQETRVRNSSKPKIAKKAPTSMSVGKRKPANSVGKRKLPGFGNDEEEITQDFKKILNKNRVDKVRTDNEKTTCLLYIISDYFKLKEIDGFFRSIIEKNPMFKSYSSKIYSNIKTPKEFTLKKLNGICKYISSGDKSGFYNFIKVKDKGLKNNFDALKSNYNNIFKKNLKNLSENEISHFCKAILEIPELTLQTTKSLLKYCE